MKRDSQGFTLIEILIALAIVAVLAAVALPNYQSYVKRAEFAQVIEDFDALKLAIELCWELEGDLKTCNSSYGEISSAIDSVTNDILVRIYPVTPDRTQVRLYSRTVMLSSGDNATIQYGAVATSGGTLGWSITENSSNCLTEGICSL